MTDLEALQLFMVGVWGVFTTPITLPFIGVTSPLLISIFLAVLALLVDLVARVLWKKSAED